jgi:predicted TIM-barrel fold metal-dependent hydrolase
VASLPYPVYDADNHLYEPKEAFLRYLPEKYQRDFYFVEANGRTKVVVGGGLSEYIPNPTFEVVAAPGTHEKWYRAQNTEGLTMRELSGKPIRPPAEWRSGEGRLKVLDQQGIHAALIFPTLASVIEERLGRSPETIGALFHSLNRWTSEEWGFARDGRLFALPMITLADLDTAVAELEFVLAQGARVISLRPAPVPDLRGPRSFGLPEYDPFWARVAEAKIFVCFHTSDSGYDRISQWWAGGPGEYLPFENDPFKLVLDVIGRAMADSISSLICHGVFDRHPKVRVAAVEAGSSWVGPLMHRFDQVYGQMPQAFKQHPRKAFEKHVFVAPYYEDDMEALARMIPVERILFGSDYPHPEGLAEPLDYLREFGSFTEDQIKRVFHSNLKGLLEGARD